jgi:hypothetical protein
MIENAPNILKGPFFHMAARDAYIQSSCDKVNVVSMCESIMVHQPYSKAVVNCLHVVVDELETGRATISYITINDHFVLMWKDCYWCYMANITPSMVTNGRRTIEIPLAHLDMSPAVFVSLYFQHLLLPAAALPRTAISHLKYWLDVCHAPRGAIACLDV